MVFDWQVGGHSSNCHFQNVVEVGGVNAPGHAVPLSQSLSFVLQNQMGSSEILMRLYVYSSAHL